MAHAERTRPAPADTPIASLDVADIRRDLEVRPRRASVRSRTWPSIGERDRIRMDEASSDQ